MTSLILAAALTLQVPSAPWLNGRRAPDAPENISQGFDWMNDSGLRCPVYDEGGNILMNPSFEGGRRYWRVQGNALDVEDFYVTNVVRSGRYALRLADRRNYQTSCVVLATNTDYVISFYARPFEGLSGSSLQVHGRGTRGTGVAPKRVWLKPTNGWHRIVHAFHTGKLQQETTFWFGGDCYIDDIQLERGTEATPYRGNPFALEIVLDSPERTYCDARKDAKPRIRLAGPVGSTGKLHVSVTDVFQRKLFTAAKRFTLGRTGEVFLPLDDKTLPKGTLVATVRVEPEGGHAFQDYLRWTKIDYLDNTQKHKNLMLDPSKGGTREKGLPESYFARYAHFGIGGWNYGPKLNEADKEWQDKYHLDVFDVSFYEGSGWLGQQTLNGQPMKWNGLGFTQMTNYPPECLAWVEENVAAYAAKNKLTKRWALATEPAGQYFVLRDFVVGDRDEYAKLILAHTRGLKRGNPDAELMPYGDWNMFAGGRGNVCDMLKRLRRMDPKSPGYFPSIEIHSYRQRPIVEKDLTGFFDDLARAGYPDIKVRIGEGSYYYPMWRQSYDIQRGCGPKDEYQNVVPVPSYDLGWGERFASMCVIREALWYYRYADHVISNCSWNPKWIGGIEPMAWIAANNAMANLLGNATFVEDVRFATDARALVFDDGKGRTVAAVWRENADFDDGKAPGTTMTMGIGDLGLGIGGLEVIDLMGNRCSIEQSNNPNNRTITLPLSGFVVYLRARNEKRAALLKALRGAKSAADEGKFPLKVDFRVTAADEVEVTVENPLARARQAVVTVDGGEHREKVAANGKATVRARPMTVAVADKSHLQAVQVKVSVEGTERALAFTNLVTAIPYAASPVDWTKVPAVSGGSQQRSYMYHPAPYTPLKVETKRVWNEREIIFRFDVTDALPPQFAAKDEYRNFAAGTFHGIRAQFYFDAFGDAGTRLRHGQGAGFGWDDFVYAVIPQADGGADCWRILAPDAQLAGGVHGALLADRKEPNVRTVFTRRPGGYIYEIAFPAWYVQPLSLKEGVVFGLAFEIFGAQNKDNLSGCRWADNCERGFLLPPPWNNPTKWTQCVLVK